MDWPTVPVEDTPFGAFVPPHCGQERCPSHVQGGFSYKNNGGYGRKQDGRWVPRYVCKVCGGGFSLQTFAFSYYLKRAALTVPIAAQLVAGSDEVAQLGRVALRHPRHVAVGHRHLLVHAQEPPDLGGAALRPGQVLAQPVDAVVEALEADPVRGGRHRRRAQVGLDVHAEHGRDRHGAAASDPGATSIGAPPAAADR